MVNYHKKTKENDFWGLKDIVKNLYEKVQQSRVYSDTYQKIPEVTVVLDSTLGNLQSDYQGSTVEGHKGTLLVDKLGVEQAVLTNTCSGINRSFDFINMMGTNPLIGPNDGGFEFRFPNMTELYNMELRNLAKKLPMKWKFSDRRVCI